MNMLCRPDAAETRKTPRLIRITGDDATLVRTLEGPLERELGDRHAFYDIRIAHVGRTGEVLVSITGSRGHVPLLLGHDDLHPGLVGRIVGDTVRRYGL
jgi:hypothetical protein